MLTLGFCVPLTLWVAWFAPDPTVALLWSCLAPLILSAFHGTAYGLLSLAMTLAFLAWGLPVIVPSLIDSPALLAQNTTLSTEYYPYQFPLSWWAGSALWVFFVGECRRFWRRRALAATTALEKANQRIERFSRNYQLLKASHNQLTQATGEITPHIRGAIRELKRVAACTPTPRLQLLGKTILDIFVDVGALQCAGFYAVQGAKLLLSHSTSSKHQLAPTDPMLLSALRSGEPQFVSGRSHNSNSQYQICIPFTDSTGTTLAIIAAEDIRFFALNNEHITLLAVLAHVCADMLNEELLSTVLEPHEEHIFNQKINAFRSKAQHYHLKACVLTVQMGRLAHSDHLRSLIGVFRDTDTLWFHNTHCEEQASQTASQKTSQTKPADGDEASNAALPVLSVFMPMTTKQEAELAIARANSRLQAKYSELSPVLMTRELTLI